MIDLDVDKIYIPIEIGRVVGDNDELEMHACFIRPFVCYFIDDYGYTYMEACLELVMRCGVSHEEAHRYLANKEPIVLEPERVPVGTEDLDLVQVIDTTCERLRRFFINSA